MAHLLKNSAALALLFASATAMTTQAQTRQTEVFLEEGHTEVQLLSGDFIGLSAGAEIVVTHDETGLPLLIEVIRGSVQAMPAFGAKSGLSVKAGGRTIVIGDGAAVITLDSLGALSVMTFSGAGPVIDGRPETRVPTGRLMRMTPDGAMTFADVTASEMAAAAERFLGGGPAAPRPGGLTGAPVPPVTAPEIAPVRPGEGVISGRRDKARDATGLNPTPGGGGGNLIPDVDTPPRPVDPDAPTPPDPDLPDPDLPDPPSPPDPPVPPDPPDIKLPPNVKDVFDKLPPGQRNDLDNLPKRFQRLVDSLTEAERKLLEEFIASLP